jgi:hypothetical protein
VREQFVARAIARGSPHVSRDHHQHDRRTVDDARDDNDDDPAHCRDDEYTAAAGRDQPAH